MRAHLKLPHSVIVKSPGLLPMLYSVRELARAVSVVERTLRDWLANGAPHLCDERGHLWVHGREFAHWVSSQRRPARRPRLKDNQAYCMHCRDIVEILEPKTQMLRGKLTHTSGTCNRCGGTVHRGGRVASNSVSIPSKGDGQHA